ncbi:hypothetical protein FRC06_002211 [Ceratobasidium sp. 370]|nr:hypothetical protein FRC06_002211 [Ceratobasidium sp. 370]
MPPLRAESSTVSLPPRERVLAKHHAKAIKLGLPPSVASESPAKGTQKRTGPAPLPTLAATHQRHAAADVAYLDRPDGYHVKRIVHQVTPGPVPPILYLPGEENIPHSDVESDDSNTTVPELTNSASLGGPGPNFDIVAKVEETPTELDTDLVDYDAEGEDDDRDKFMQGKLLFLHKMQYSSC